MSETAHSRQLAVPLCPGLPRQGNPRKSPSAVCGHYLEQCPGGSARRRDVHQKRNYRRLAQALLQAATLPIRGRLRDH